MKHTYIFFLISLLALFFCSCEKYDDDPLYPAADFIAEGTYQGDYWPTESWRKCAPEEVGMDPMKLKELNEEMRLLMEMEIDVHGVLIVKDGYIVAEQYYSEDYGPDSLHRIASCTKSITSALFGIALDKGYLSSLDQRMVDFFPDREIQNRSEFKESITLEDLLTMSSGLEWYELEYPYGDERNTFRQWVNQGGGIQFVLDQPMVAAPGYVYAYNSGASQVLSGILQRVTGVRTDSFALEHLFKPLGIDSYDWPADKNGIAFGGGSTRFTPRDMARFAYLYLKEGEWEGKQVVSREWVEISQQKHIKRKYIEDYYYGYHWWVSEKHTFSAVGYAGQWITVVPDQNLVVVFTNNFSEGESFQWSTPERLMETYIMPALN